MPQTDLDKASRYAAKIDSMGFVCWILGLPADKFRFRDWLDTRKIAFPGDPDRTGDTVASLEKLAEGGVPWAIPIEFQADPDSLMFGRALGYLSAVWIGLKPDEERGSRYHVGFVIVNLSGVGNCAREMRWSEAGLITNLGVVERNLEQESADELLSAIESGQWSRCLLPWAPLMKGGDTPALVSRWKLLAEAEPDSRRRSDYAALALIFAEKAKCQNLWQDQLKGWNMTGSIVGDRFRAEGRAEVSRELILQLGAKRFGCGPSRDEQTTLNAIADSAQLEKLVLRILDVSSWADLLRGS
jgi:hypothetical protein